METQEKLVKIDLIDKKILAVLLRNGRINTKELARLIKHNYPTVRNRIGRLIDSKVITHFYPVLQVPGIGCRRFMSVYVSLKTLTLEKQEKILKELMKLPLLIEILELQGKWNFSILLVSNYLKESYHTLNKIQEICAEHLNNFTVLQTYLISPLNRKFFLDEEYDIELDKIKTGYQPLIQKVPMIHLEKPVKLNKEDMKLLNYLKLNARDSFEEIKEAIGIEQAVAHYKIKKYIQTNLIKYFTIEVDNEKLGYSKHVLFLHFRGSEEGKNKFVQEMYKHKKAYHLFQYLDYWEIAVTFCVKSQQEINQIVDNILKKYGEYIKNQELLLVKKIHKSHPYPNIEEVYPTKN